MILRIGARGSALSQAQAALVVGALQGRVEATVVTFRTTGDRLSSVGAEISGKGIFTKEIDEALLDGRVDLGVHSLKDLPSEMPDGLVLSAVPVREDPRDVLLSGSGHPLALLPPGSRIGTASPRRRAQLLASRPDCPVSDARGNVDTRIRRLREGRWEAIVLARAGLARLGRLDEVTEVFEEDRMLPAIGQGALALVTRAEDGETRRIVAALDDVQAHSESDAERELLRHLEAGCRAPLAGRARVSGEELRLTARVFSRDGDRILEARGEGSARNPREVGRRVAEELLQRGAGLLISEARAE
ncbi:MAG: hydroxymethylbilane synthase [Thermoanaerobaculia bacterium]|nr:hydroxymethylbilane synthase [Thermoanaerobaculia bacterium]